MSESEDRILSPKVKVIVRSQDGVAEDGYSYSFGEILEVSSDRAMELFKAGQVTPVDENDKVPSFVETR